MPNAGNIADIINSKLQSGNFSSRDFQNGKFTAIAEPIKTYSKDGEESISPYIIDNRGEGEILVYEDVFPFVVFHLKDGFDYPNTPDDDNFGNAGQTVQEIANMRLIFVGSRNRMKVSTDNVMSAIAMDFPREFTQSQIQGLSITKCTIEMGSINSNPYDIWQNIWTNKKYEFDTDIIIVSVPYKITSLYTKNCFKLCQTNQHYYN